MSAVAADIGNNVTTVFDELKRASGEWVGKRDSLDGWPFMAGTIETRLWWDRVWSPLSAPKKIGGRAGIGLQGELYDLARQSGTVGKPLANLLKSMITGRGNFLQLSRQLPPILISIGKEHGNDSLVTRAERWSREVADFEKWMAELEGRDAKSSKKKDKSSSAEKPAEKPAKSPSLVPGQNTAAEKIVNDVLRSLPSGIAGDIRRAISKSSNKIMALQAELARRGIRA